MEFMDTKSRQGTGMTRKIVYVMAITIVALTFAGCGNEGGSGEGGASGNGVYNNLSTVKPVIRQ